MRLLALDLATRFGFAFGDGGEPVFGAKQLTPSGENIAAMLGEFDDWLSIFVKAQRVSVIVFEMPVLPRMTQLMTTRKLHGLAAFCEWRARGLQCAVYEARTQLIKKFWTGKGNAKKPDMVATANGYGYRIAGRPLDPDKQDDEADALALYWYSVCKKHPDRFATIGKGQLLADG